MDGEIAWFEGYNSQWFFLDDIKDALKSDHLCQSNGPIQRQAINAFISFTKVATPITEEQLEQVELPVL